MCEKQKIIIDTRYAYKVFCSTCLFFKQELRLLKMTENITTLIEKLYQTNNSIDESFLRVLFKRKKSNLELRTKIDYLSEIGNIGRPQDIKYIFSFCFNTNIVIADAAAAAVRSIVENNLDDTQYSKVFQKLHYFKEHKYSSLMQDQYVSDGFYGHFTIPPNQFPKIYKLKAENQRYVIALLSISFNGYCREEAIKYMDKEWCNEFLPFLILRLEDCVSQVQGRAYNLYAKIFSSLNVEILLKHLSLAIDLDKKLRFQKMGILSSIGEKISCSDSVSSILNCVQGKSIKVRQFCINSLLKNEKHLDQVIEMAIVDADPQIRAWAATNLPENKHYQKRVRTLYSDSAARVRYALLKSLTKEQLASDFIDLKIAMFDNSYAIRDFARYYYKVLIAKHDKLSAYEFDFSGIYVEQLKQYGKKSSFGMIMGFAETCSKRDAKMLEPYLDHSNGRIRAAIIDACLNLVDNPKKELLVSKLQDRSNRVTRVIRDYLVKSSYPIQDDLLNILQDRQYAQRKDAILVVLNSLAERSLEQLYPILIALNIDDAKLQKVALSHLLIWDRNYNYRFSANEPELELINKQIKEIMRNKKLRKISDNVFFQEMARRISELNERKKCKT